MTGEVCHFEVPATNVERAKKFYSRAFGWKASNFPGMDYTIVQTGPAGRDGRPKEKGVINGGIAKKNKDFQHINVVLYVEDIDAAIEKIKKFGGKLQGKKAPIPGMGWNAYFKDTEGNVVGLFQPGSE